MLKNIYLNAIHELLMAVGLNTTVCCDVTPCSFVSVLPNTHVTGYQISGESNLDIPVWFFEILKSLHRYTQSHCIQSHPHKWDDVLQCGLSVYWDWRLAIMAQTIKITFFFPFNGTELNEIMRQVLLGRPYADLILRSRFHTPHMNIFHNMIIRVKLSL